MTGYIKQLATRHLLLQIRRVHGLRYRRSHVLGLPARPPALPLQQLLVGHVLPEVHQRANEIVGPFELTKLSAQISVLMADRNDGCKQNDAIRKSYQNLGTWRTAQNLVRHRGWTGLYSGFHLHLRKCNESASRTRTNMKQYEILSVRVSTSSRMKA